MNIAWTIVFMDHIMYGWMAELVGHSTTSADVEWKRFGGTAVHHTCPGVPVMPRVTVVDVREGAVVS